ncbi:MAG: mechanosensitive ion channel [Deltaproteobacteria bacterium]|jgi:small-conductance mechanosensitive channel|nr:mechanosensitive ion channel [Deltaproteobacteria bacterium]
MAQQYPVEELSLATQRRPGAHFERFVQARLRARAIVLLMLAFLATPFVGPIAAPSARAQAIEGAPGAPASAHEVDPLDPAEIARRREELALEIDSLREGGARAAGNEGWQGTEARLQALGEIESLLARQAELASPPSTDDRSEIDGLEELPPSSFALRALLELQLDLEEEDQRHAATVASRREALARAGEALERAERSRREAKVAIAAAKNESARDTAERELEARQLSSRSARERLHLRTLELREAERARRNDSDRGQLADRIARMRRALLQGEGEWSAGIEELRQQEAELRQSREEIQRRLSTAELRLEAASGRFSRIADPPAQLLEEVEMLVARRDASRSKLAIADARLDRLASQRSVWRDWNSLLRGEATREQIETSKESILDRIRLLEEIDLQRTSENLDLERRLETLERRMRGLSRDDPLSAILEEKRSTLTDLLESVHQDLNHLARDRRLSTLVLADLRERSGEVDLREYVLRSLHAIRNIWSFEITVVDDSAITVGSVVLAFVLAALGFWVSRRGSGAAGRVAATRFRLDPGATHALETISFYVLLVSFLLLALRAVHFPLTAFTVLGGALAIGIGFGSQNVMNNFISGLILMMERPVRAGDVVEIDGNHGTIERIGARSTRIRSTDGRQIIVPNSFFLESNVVNWTLSDDLIRTCVVVGVVYGSPTRLVESLIRRVVDEEKSILPEPAPILLFSEFGDNSLNFEIHFWVRARGPMQRRIVESHVRFRIDDLFREHEIVIAFPQRDVHLDSVSPIEVRLTDEAQPRKLKEGER